MFGWSLHEKQKIKDWIHETKMKIRSLVHCTVILVSFQIMGREVGVQSQFSGTSSGGNLCYMQWWEAKECTLTFVLWFSRCQIGFCVLQQGASSDQGPGQPPKSTARYTQEDSNIQNNWMVKPRATIVPERAVSDVRHAEMESIQQG